MALAVAAATVVVALTAASTAVAAAAWERRGAGVTAWGHPLPERCRRLVMVTSCKATAMVTPTICCYLTATLHTR
jgi:hypothetical protein